MPNITIAGANPASAAPAARDPKIWQAAEDFEAVLLSQLTKHMFDTKGVGDDNFKGGFAEDTWQGMMAQEMGKSIARRGGIGLADAVYREMINMQNAQQSKAKP